MTEKEHLGNQQEEKVYNNTSASLHSNVIPNTDMVAKYDQYYKRDNKGMTLKTCLLLIFLATCIYFLIRSQWAFAAVSFVALSLFFWRIFPQNTGVPVDVAYRYGLLIPGIVIQEDPVVIVALANIRTDGGDTQFACKKIKIKRYNPYIAHVNKKVPCVAMFKCRRNGIWTNFEPRPVAWATFDIRVIQGDISAIDKEEWDFLKKIKNKVPDMQDDQIALFDDWGSFKKVLSCHHSEKKE